MTYSLLSDIQRTVAEQDEFNQLLEKAIDALGFNRDEVLLSEDDINEVLTPVTDKDILQEVEMRGSMGRAHDMDFVKSASQVPTKGMGDKQSRLGLKKAESKPSVGDKVIVGKRVAEVIAANPDGKQVMIQVPNGEPKLVDVARLTGRPLPKGGMAWMVAK